MSFSKMNERSCLIVGAGMAGLTAGRILQDAGVRVPVLDKGRSVGGRMATRRFGEGVFDHGAQFISVRDDEFRSSMQAWQAKGAAAMWAQGFALAGQKQASNGHPRFRGEPGMTAIPKTMAEQLDVHVAERVQSAHVDGGLWRIETSAGDTYEADALLLTPPVPQSMALLDAGSVRLPAAMAEQLRAIEYHPCLALLVLFNAPTSIPSPGGLQFEQGPIRWMADNEQKGISPNAVAVTIHAAPTFSCDHWDSDETEVARRLLEAAAEWLPSTPVDWQLHRWRYSQPVVTDAQQTSAYEYFAKTPSPVAFAGDAFAGGRVEGAAISGRRAAQRILDALSAS